LIDNAEPGLESCDLADIIGSEVHKRRPTHSDAVDRLCCDQLSDSNTAVVRAYMAQLLLRCQK